MEGDRRRFPCACVHFVELETMQSDISLVRGTRYSHTPWSHGQAMFFLWAGQEGGKVCLDTMDTFRARQRKLASAASLDLQNNSGRLWSCIVLPTDIANRFITRQHFSTCAKQVCSSS